MPERKHSFLKEVFPKAMTNSFQISISKVYLFATYDFLNVGKRIAQQILGTGMDKCIPNSWEWE